MQVSRKALGNHLTWSGARVPRSVESLRVQFPTLSGDHLLRLLQALALTSGVDANYQSNALVSWTPNLRHQQQQQTPREVVERLIHLRARKAHVDNLQHELQLCVSQLRGFLALNHLALEEMFIRRLVTVENHSVYFRRIIVLPSKEIFRFRFVEGKGYVVEQCPPPHAQGLSEPMPQHLRHWRPEPKHQVYSDGTVVAAGDEVSGQDKPTFTVNQVSPSAPCEPPLGSIFGGPQFADFSVDTLEPAAEVGDVLCYVGEMSVMPRELKDAFYFWSQEWRESTLPNPATQQHLFQNLLKKFLVPEKAVALTFRKRVDFSPPANVDQSLFAAVPKDPGYTGPKPQIPTLQTPVVPVRSPVQVVGNETPIQALLRRYFTLNQQWKRERDAMDEIQRLRQATPVLIGDTRNPRNVISRWAESRSGFPRWTCRFVSDKNPSDTTSAVAQSQGLLPPLQRSIAATHRAFPLVRRSAWAGLPTKSFYSRRGTVAAGGIGSSEVAVNAALRKVNLKKRLSGHAWKPIYCIAFDKTGRIVISGGDDQ